MIQQLCDAIPLITPSHSPVDLTDMGEAAKCGQDATHT